MRNVQPEGAGMNRFLIVVMYRDFQGVAAKGKAPGESQFAGSPYLKPKATVKLGASDSKKAWRGSLVVELPDEWIWKIIMAEYTGSGHKPRTWE